MERQPVLRDRQLKEEYVWVSHWIREEFELGAHLLTIRKLDRAYSAELATAGTASEREKAAYRHHWETLLYREQIDEIKTRRRLRRAGRFNVPIEAPSQGSPLWRWSAQLNVWCLTSIGHSELEILIMQERRRRSRKAADSVLGRRPRRDIGGAAGTT